MFSLFFVSDPNRINFSFAQINVELNNDSGVNDDSDAVETYPNMNENENNDDDDGDNVRVLVQLDEDDLYGEVEIGDSFEDHGIALVKQVLEADETSSASESAEVLKALANKKCTIFRISLPCSSIKFNFSLYSQLYSSGKTSGIEWNCSRIY